MKKMLLVISLVLCLSAFSAAKDTFYNFTLDGFCDGMSLRLYTPGAPVPKILVGGLHVLGDCVNNFNVGGFKHGISPTVQYPGSTGAVLDVSDPLLGLECVLATLGHPQVMVGPPCGPWRRHPTARTSRGSAPVSECDRQRPTPRRDRTCIPTGQGFQGWGRRKGGDLHGDGVQSRFRFDGRSSSSRPASSSWDS